MAQVGKTAGRDVVKRQVYRGPIKSTRWFNWKIFIFSNQPFSPRGQKLSPEQAELADEIGILDTAFLQPIRPLSRGAPCNALRVFRGKDE
jgi:hypothetical protein